MEFGYFDVHGAESETSALSSGATVDIGTDDRGILWLLKGPEEMKIVKYLEEPIKAYQCALMLTLSSAQRCWRQLTARRRRQGE